MRYIPLAPDSRTDPYMVAIQSSLDSLLDAVISGSMSMSLDLLTANMLNNINLVQASLLKMVTNRRTKEAVEKRCETLRKMIATLKIYARLALAERPGADARLVVVVVVWCVRVCVYVTVSPTHPRRRPRRGRAAAGTSGGGGTARTA